MNLGTYPKENFPAESMLSDQYDLFSSHAYAIKGYNEATDMVYISNPWQGSTIIEVPMNELIKYVNTVGVANLENVPVISGGKSAVVHSGLVSSGPMVSSAAVPKSDLTLNYVETYAETGVRSQATLSELNNLKSEISDALAKIKAGEVSNAEEVLNNIEKLYNKSLLNGREYALKGTMDKYTVNSLRQELGLPINYLDVKMQAKLSRYPAARAKVMTDVYNTIGDRIAKGEVPSKDLLNDVIYKKAVETGLKPEDLEKQFFLGINDSYVWSASDFRKSQTQIYSSNKDALIDKYKDGFGIKSQAKPIPTRMGLNDSDGTFFTMDEVKYLSKITVQS